MQTFYISTNQITKNNTIYIDGDDYNHIKNVLRLKINEKIWICDNNQKRYYVNLEKYDIEQSRVYFSIIEKTDFTTEPIINIDLYQGLPKGEKFEIIIQKATELGINEIFPVCMNRTIVKIDSDSEQKKLERWNKIAKEASKQSGRQKIPIVSRITNLKNFIENIEKYDIVLLPFENEHSVSIKTILDSNSKAKNIAIIIGPEGGFSDEEITQLTQNPNVKLCTLGSRILRTETAAIATISMIIYKFDL